jgi:hypothetical protein
MSKSYPSSMDIIGVQVPTQNLRHLVHPSKTVPSPGVRLRQIQVVVTWAFSQGKLSHSDLILLSILYHTYPNELFKYYFVCVVCVRIMYRYPVYCPL